MAISETISRFITTVSDGNMDEARALLAAEPDMPQHDINVAAIVGDADSVARLLAEDPSRATAEGGPRSWAPLLYLAHSRFHRDDPARAEGIARAAKLLLDHGADTNTSYIDPAFPDSPLTVLYVATGVTNNPALARVLLEEGANPNDSESIYHAAEANNRECLEILLEHGCDISSRGKLWGNTPLYFLMGHWEDSPIGATSTEGIRWLLEHGADPNVTSYDCEETPLHLAARSGRSRATAELLLRHGADPNRQAKNGRTPHTMAERSGNQAVTELLLEHGAVDQCTLVDRFLGACSRGDADGARAMISEHPNLVAGLDADDLGLLATAGALNRIDAVRTMLDAGFDVAARGEQGGTVLHHAAWWGHPDVVDLILEHNPPLEVRCTAYEGTPLDWAVHGSFSSPNRDTGDYVSIVESILAAGAPPSTGLINAARPEVAEVIHRYAGKV
jgi:ankyrin repeat protein